MYKITVYVPEEQAEAVKTAMFSAGAGRYQNYSHCSWETRGTGQFLALEGSNPALGSPGTVERVTELRIEMICLREYLEPVIQALEKAHPYEVPAYDVIKLSQIKSL